MIRLFNEKWTHVKSDSLQLYFIGWFEYKKVIYNEVDTFIVSLFEKENIKDLLQEFNGSFAFIISQKSDITIIADRNRSFPILYFFENNQITITDYLPKYMETISTVFSLDDRIAEQYFSSSFIFDKYTLFQNVFSIQAGEIVYIDKKSNDITSQNHYQWLPNMNVSSKKRNLKIEAKLQDNIFLNVIKRMVKSCPNVNNWVIPLSGGYDSRILVNYLYKLGIRNVICYSYGVVDNNQSQLSKQVAEALDYQWYFIDYSEWTEKLQKTSQLEDYIGYAFNGSSTAHLQDFPAVFALKELNVLNKNDVFVPGHTLDFISGGHLIESMNEIKSKSGTFPFLERHFSNLDFYSNNKPFHKHISEIVNNIQAGHNQIPEYFNWKERQSKFIVNSVRCYDYFGYEWRIPLWDKELMDYWIKIEYNFRMERGLFKEVFKEFLIVDELKDIPFYNDFPKNKNRTFKERIKNAVPTSIKTKLRGIGFKTSSFYKINEGLNLVYSDRNETIESILTNYKFPDKLKMFIMKYYKQQEIRYFNINTITSILLLKKFYNKNSN